MTRKEEIIADIRNKLQTAYSVVENISNGKNVPESFISLVEKDLNQASKLFAELKK